MGKMTFLGPSCPKCAGVVLFVGDFDVAGECLLECKGCGHIWHHAREGLEMEMSEKETPNKSMDSLCDHMTVDELLAAGDWSTPPLKDDNAPAGDELRAKLSPFIADPLCLKCGSTVTAMEYRGPEPFEMVSCPECISRTCSRCGYTWRHATRDSTEDSSHG